MSDDQKTQATDEVEETAENTESSVLTEETPVEEIKTIVTPEFTEEVLTTVDDSLVPETPVEDLPVDAVKPDSEIEKERVIKALKPGMTVKVYQKIRETNTKGEVKERLQMYEGMILAIKHGREIGSTMTVRKLSGGIGVEKIFPIFSPNVAKIEMVKQAKVRQAKLYYLRERRKKKLKETKL